MAGVSTAAASDWSTCRPPHLITMRPLRIADLFALPDLSAYGDLVVTEEAGVHDVPDANAATAETGVAPPDVALLPRGVTGEPVYAVIGKVSATFTFSTGGARWLRTIQSWALPLPPDLDGAQVRLQAGPGSAAAWSQSSGLPRLVVARTVAPRVDVVGRIVRGDSRPT